jgi:catechol-2,3-dioxygenase
MNKFVEDSASENLFEDRVPAVANVALGVNNLGSMKKFYQEVLGFELLGEFPSAALLKVRTGCSPRGQKLGLLQRSSLKHEPRKIEHVAFVIPVLDPQVERKRLEGLGLKVAALNLHGNERELLSFQDPEGNEVELLCCGPILDN